MMKAGITLLVCILETESSIVVIADWYTIHGKFVPGVFFEIKRTLTIFPTIDVSRELFEEARNTTKARSPKARKEKKHYRHV